jgi:class 3 adenylate cyclase/tetratricopeptide (TPR) repeat protein
MTCTSCAATIPDGARFCPSCGHAVGFGTNEERRIVTVLFADLVGFTTLAEFMDPERAKRLVDRCFEQLIDDITSFGGRVDKILGDGLLALFGAPVAHEDDPERAVRAGLRMQESLTANTGAADIRMRVGINTGEVLVGTLAGTDYTAMGDVVNTASRLQSQAPPGRVIVGESTYSLTAHTIGYESAGELVARGREQGVKAWLAIGATAPPGLRRLRRDVAMVGREAELAIARTGLEVALLRGSAVLLNVSGESGVGKSRLVDEVLQRLVDDVDAKVISGACVPYGEANIWWPVANALSGHFGIDLTHGPEEIRAVIGTLAGELEPPLDAATSERVIDVVTHLLGHPSGVDRLDAASARSAIQRTVTKVLQRSADRRPTVLSIDNLHWADPALIDLLAHLARSLSRSPFALVTAMRPDADIDWPPRVERTTVLSLALQALNRAETDELALRLIADLVPDRVPDARQLGDLYDRSGGNPLFLQELAALIARGGAAGELPDSLRTLIGARLDQLTSIQRQVLDNAATLGTSGSISSLERFGGAMSQPFDPTTLRELDDFGLLDVTGKRWEFRSDSVRESAYQTLSKASRAQRHAGVAIAIRTNSPGSIDELAHHLATAAELEQDIGLVAGVPATIVADAVDALTASATRALESGSLHTVVRDTTRALDLIGADPDSAASRAALRLLRAGALVERRDYTSARADIDAAIAWATTEDDLVVEGRGRRLLGNLHHAEGHLDVARVELGQAVEILRGVDEPHVLAEALRSRGFIELFGGSLVDAEWFFGEADAIFRDLDDRRGMAWIEQHRAWIGFMSGNFAAAGERLQHAAAALEELGDRNGVGWASGLLAYVEFFQGNSAAAEELAVEVSREAEERGDEWASGMMQTLLANVRLWGGHPTEAVLLAEKARNRFRATGDRWGLGQALAPLIRAQVALGRSAAALRTDEELIALADLAPLGPGPLLAAAGAAMHRGDGLAAAAHATRVIAEIRGAGGSALEPVVILAVGLAQAGRIDEARATIESIAGEAADHPFVDAAAALIDMLVRDPTGAIDHATRVERTESASYLDRIIAFVAAAGALAQTGEVEQARLTAEAAVVLAVQVGDVVAVALATRAFARLTGTTHPAHDDRTVLGDGWMHVVDSMLDSPVTVA